MVFDVDAAWLNQQAQYDAGELRRADTALLVAPGVSRTLQQPDALSVSVDGSDQVTVQPGSVAVSGEDAVAGTGFYRFGIGSAHSEQLQARDATNARIDLVVARVLDTDVVGSHGAYTGRIEVIEGTPSATPGVPTKPDIAVELARITVPVQGGGAASVDESHREYACTQGGVLTVPQAGALPNQAPEGQRARTLGTGRAYEFDGSSWGAPSVETHDVVPTGAWDNHGMTARRWGPLVVMSGAWDRRPSVDYQPAGWDTLHTLPAAFRPVAPGAQAIMGTPDSSTWIKCRVTPGGSVDIFMPAGYVLDRGSRIWVDLVWFVA